MNQLLRIANEMERALSRSLSVLSEPAMNRMVGLSLMFPSWAVLGFARYLTPSPQGFGTHTQLGLGGCTMLTFTGWPCPMCGMTTTFSHFAHLQVVEGFWNQPFGIILFSMTLVAAVIGPMDLVAGKGVWRRVLRFFEPAEQYIAGGLLVGMFLGWVYKCLKMHPEILTWIP